MLELRFKARELRDRCSDMGTMIRAWGPERAARVARRLQQLAAMASVDDLTFLPFESSKQRDGRVQVGVDAQTTIVVSHAGTRPLNGVEDRKVTVLIVDEILVEEADGDG